MHQHGRTAHALCKARSGAATWTTSGAALMAYARPWGAAVRSRCCQVCTTVVIVAPLKISHAYADLVLLSRKRCRGELQQTLSHGLHLQNEELFNIWARACNNCNTNSLLCHTLGSKYGGRECQQ